MQKLYRTKPFFKNYIKTADYYKTGYVESLHLHEQIIIVKKKTSKNTNLNV